MTKVITRDCDCSVIYYGGQKRPDRCEHGNHFLTEAQQVASQKPRGSLRPISEKRAAEETAGTRPRSNGSTLAQTNTGFTASPAQRKKVRNLACLVCGRDRHEAEIEAAHVCARRLAPHCDCPDGVVPLCHECHQRYDDLGAHFDLLPALITHGYRAEVVHAFLEHGVGLVDLLSHISGERYLPASAYQDQINQQLARIVELESRVAA